MIHIYRYDDAEQKLETIVVSFDDRNIQVACLDTRHEFAPQSLECACGKYEMSSMEALLNLGK